MNVFYVRFYFLFSDLSLQVWGGLESTGVDIGDPLWTFPLLAGRNNWTSVVSTNPVSNERKQFLHWIAEGLWEDAFPVFYDLLYVYAGSNVDFSVYYFDLLRLHTRSMEWEEISTTSDGLPVYEGDPISHPCARTGVHVAQYGNFTFFFGGSARPSGKSADYNDLWVFNTLEVQPGIDGWFALFYMSNNDLLSSQVLYSHR